MQQIVSIRFNGSITHSLQEVARDRTLSITYRIANPVLADRKTDNLSALSLKRHLGVTYSTAQWKGRAAQAQAAGGGSPARPAPLSA
jgi:hypothetical protein